MKILLIFQNINVENTDEEIREKYYRKCFESKQSLNILKYRLNQMCIYAKFNDNIKYISTHS